MSHATEMTRDEERQRNHDNTGKCAFESIKEMVGNLYDWQQAAESEGWTGPHKDKYGATYFKNEDDDSTWACADWKELCADQKIDATERSEDGEQTIHEDPLEVSVRSDWHAPGAQPDKPTEYLILLSTGGPATRIVGDLSEYGEPTNARLEVQDWFVPWQEWRGEGWNEDTLLEYARCFYFGE